MTARKARKHSERVKGRPSSDEAATRHTPNKARSVSSDPPAPRWHSLMPLIIFFAALAVYTNSMNGAFLLDDHPFIEINKNIRHLTNAFSRNSQQEARPLVYFSLAINYALGELHPTGYHLFNLLIHVLAAWTLFGIVRRTLLSPRLETRFKESSRLFALAITLLWTVHPIQTESVSYVFQRSESMMALCYLLSLYCLIRGATQTDRSGRWYIGVVVFAGLGTSCKAVIITLPAVLWLYDRVFLSGSFIESLRRRWPVYLGTVLIILVVGLSFSDIHRMAAAQMTPRVVATSVDFKIGRADNLIEYFRSQPTVILHYLKLSFWPIDLCLDYKMEPIQGTEQIAFTSAALLILLLSTGLLLARFPAMGFPLAFLFIVLAPTSVYWRLELVFEHRMYLPLAGLISFTVFACYLGLLQIGNRFQMSPRALFRAAMTLLLVTLCALGLRTIVRNRDYKNVLSMYRAVVEVSPENPRGRFNLANHLTTQYKDLRQAGRSEEARKVLAETISHYEAAVQISPAYLPARINLSNAYLFADRLDDAISQLRRIVELKPDHKTALYNLALNLRNRAVSADQSGDRKHAREDLDESLRYYRRSLKERPDHMPSLLGINDVLYQLHRYDEAIPFLRQYLKYNPNNPGVLRRLSEMLLRTGKHDEAKEVVRALLKIEPSDKWGRAKLREIESKGSSPLGAR